MWFVLLQIILLGSAVVGIATWRLPMRVWIPGVAGLLFLLTAFSSLANSWLLIFAWLIFLAVIVILGIPSIRHDWLTVPMLARLRKVLPPMSETEQIALEAGDVWWEAELFQGRPNWQKLCQLSLPQLSEEEQHFIDNQVEVLCDMLKDYEIVYKLRDLPRPVWDYIKKEGFWGLVIPKEFGGRGFSALAHSAIIAKIASRSISAAVDVMVPNSLGPGELLLRYGTEKQKQYYLPRLARGEETPCFALTSAQAGSDATAIPDTGIICKDLYKGKEIVGIRLNFDKRYITLAPIATLIGLAFKLYDPDHLFGEQEDLGITTCLLPAKHPGVEIGERHSPLGLAFMNGPIRGKDVFIPLDWIIGGPTMAGQGWRMLMECLSIGRSISLPALSTGISMLCYRMTGAYAYIRKQFKLPIGHFEGIEELLAKIAGSTYIMEAARRLTAGAVDNHLSPSVASAIAKYYMTEITRKTVNHAMDIHAGRGIQLGPHNYLGLVYQAIPLSVTAEGANILTRNLIIFGQGAIQCHPYVRAEMAAVADPDRDQGFAKFDKLLLKHVGFTVSNWITSLAMGLGLTRIITVPAGMVKQYYRQLSRMSSALAFSADITLLLLGGALKRKERLSARLGDVLSYLYLASSVLKYYEDQNRPTEDLAHVTWALEMCLYQIQIVFDEFFVNLPNRWLAAWLRFTIFPFGARYKKPADKLDQELAHKIQENSALRDRLTQLCYVGKEARDATGCIDQALTKLLAAQPLENELQEAIKNDLVTDTGNYEKNIKAGLKARIFTKDEAELIFAAERLRKAAIAVDEFKSL